MLLHRGFVVAGAGLFNDPEKGGLTTKPLSHFVHQCLFYFLPLLTSKLDARNKIKKALMLRIKAL